MSERAIDAGGVRGEDVDRIGDFAVDAPRRIGQQPGAQAREPAGHGRPHRQAAAHQPARERERRQAEERPCASSRCGGSARRAGTARRSGWRRT